MNNLASSVALEMAIGLVFCYASISVIASSVYEAFASLLRLRARSLLAGVKALLNDPGFGGLARLVYQHALVNPRSNGSAATAASLAVAPSYIDPRAFAVAMVDAIQKVPEGFELLRQKIDAVADPQLRTLLQGMYVRADGKVERFEAALARWFDGAMDRVSGAYKRQAQLCTFVIAVVIAGLFNVDSFHLFTTLWQHPAAAATMAAPGSAPGSVAEAAAALRTLPVGWTTAAPASIPFAVCGWFVTAVSVLFGAPFWFDLLQRLTNLRGAGAKPPTTLGAGPPKDPAAPSAAG
jgi:hypothetical protein